jgi:phenylacetate-coenzyme A ligase PaaK-like adenylate-forming protein
VLHKVNNIFSVNDESFNDQALQLFKYQFANNKVYNQWVSALHVNVKEVKRIEDIPFMPVNFFKTHQVITGNINSQTIFESSGTTGQANSKHFVNDPAIYIESFTKGFEIFYGDVKEWCIIGLLPSYLERGGSSLVYMADHLIRLSGHPSGGFYLSDFKKLSSVLQQLEKTGQRTLLIGVTFALLDFAEEYPVQLNHTIIMETGGMKGRRKETIREEVHDIIKKQLGVTGVHSEYGMTELLSQAYSYSDGNFKTVPWMKVMVRNEDDPLQVCRHGRGIINVIDLANVHSCSFLATDDIGIINPDDSFKVLGRTDNSDLRGCSLLAL